MAKLQYKTSFLAILALSLLFFSGCATQMEQYEGAYAHAEKQVTVETGDNNGIPEHTDRIPIPVSQLDPSLCDMIHFDYDKSEIKSEWVECLNKITNYFQQNQQYDLLIEGHCDERGTNEYNMALGERRANSAANHIVSRDLSASRIITRSKGEEEPLQTCSNESCWSVNRRAEFYAIPIE